MTTEEQSRFQRLLSLEARDGGDGRYRAYVGEEWNCPLVPHGGIVTAVAARAVECAVAAPQQRLRSVSAVFAGQVQPGDVDIDVTVLRRGRSISQATVTVRSPGADAGLTAVAVLGATRRGFEFTDVAAPSVPGPEECPSFRDPPPEGFERTLRFNFWDHVEGRPAKGHAPWEDYEPTTSETSCWYRFDEPPLTADGRLEPLAVLALCDTMPSAVGERLGPRREMYLPPSADLTVHLLGDTTSEWVCTRNRARHASDGYASTEIELWSADGSLLAYGTQTMFFSFPEGAAAPDRARAGSGAGS
jgi:acyl-CoA thioesterase